MYICEYNKEILPGTTFVIISVLKYRCTYACISENNYNFNLEQNETFD